MTPTSSVDLMEDIDQDEALLVQMAAEALGGLRSHSEHSFQGRAPQERVKPSSLTYLTPPETMSTNTSVGSSRDESPTHSNGGSPRGSVSGVHNDGLEREGDKKTESIVHMETVEDIETTSVSSGPMAPGGGEPHASHFVYRVINIPYVKSHIESFSTAYTATKATSRVLKYSAESVESGITSITRPVLNKLDPFLRPVDKFACTQLDRLETRFPGLVTPDGHDQMDMSKQGVYNHQTKERHQQQLEHLDPNHDANYRYQYQSHGGREQNHHHTQRFGELPRHGNAPRGTYKRPEESKQTGPYTAANVGNKNLPGGGATTSGRWYTKVVPTVDDVRTSVHNIVHSQDELGTQAVTYCIDWLNFASNRIGSTISSLNEHMAYLQSTTNFQGANTVRAREGSESGHMDGVENEVDPKSNSRIVVDPTSKAETPLNGPSAAYLAEIKMDLVNTLRQMLDIVGKTAVEYLPADSRNAVKTFILDLPSKCGSLRPGSTTQEEAERVLELAQEAGQVVDGVGKIFSNAQLATHNK